MMTTGLHKILIFKKIKITFSEILLRSNKGHGKHPIYMIRSRSPVDRTILDSILYHAVRCFLLCEAKFFFLESTKISKVPI